MLLLLDRSRRYWVLRTFREGEAIVDEAKYLVHTRILMRTSELVGCLAPRLSHRLQPLDYTGPLNY